MKVANQKSINVGVIIGRFEPVHNGHKYLAEYAMSESDLLIVVLGSSNRHQSVKNPFTPEDRIKMFKGVMGPNANLEFIMSSDNLYKEWSWKAGIIKRAREIIASRFHDPEDVQVTLYGHEKDGTTYYLDEFPEWNLVKIDNHQEIDATMIRESLFGEGIVPAYVLPEYVQKFLHEYKETEEYVRVKEEYDYYQKQEDDFKDYPYHETLQFDCADGVVACQGYVLLIRRKNAPGKGTWALPGGYKERNETFLDCAIRELREETKLKVAEPVLRGSVVGKRMFDHPARSIGIPKVTMAHHIELRPNHDGSLPDVRGSSDAFEAKWVSFADIEQMRLYEDHEDILKCML